MGPIAIGLILLVVLVLAIVGIVVSRIKVAGPNEAFIVPPGTPHSVQTIGNSVMVEASNDVSDDRVRVEDKYDIDQFIDVDV